MNHEIKYLATTLCLILLLTPACNRNGIGASSGGVSLPGSGGNSGNSGNGGSNTAAISESDKPLDVMLKAMRTQLDAKSYRAHATSTLPDGTTNKMLIEYVAPDSYRMTQAGQGGAAGNSTMEYVIVKGAMYMKMPNGQWAKSPVDVSEMIKAFRDPKILDDLAKMADVKFVGRDTLDGAPMLVYQYTQNNSMGMKLKSTSKTWVAVANGLPRQTESEGEFNGSKTKTLITMSDYNADIKIESPVK
jgi:hypothetical protein